MYDDERIFTVDIINTKNETIECTIFIDGKEQNIELSQDNHYEFLLKESNDWHKITIDAKDKAGNKADTVSYKILVSSNWFTRFINNPPLLAATIAGTIGVIGLIIFVVIRRKKRKQNNSKAGESK